MREVTEKFNLEAYGNDLVRLIADKAGVNSCGDIEDVLNNIKKKNDHLHKSLTKFLEVYKKEWVNTDSDAVFTDRIKTETDELLVVLATDQPEGR